MNNKVIKLAKIGVLVALASIIGYFESLVPPIVPILPFARIGLSNIIVIVAIIRIDITAGLFISILKSLIVPIILGNPMIIMYSFPASLISTIFMIMLLHQNKISLITISILSAVIHNLVQIFCAYVYIESVFVFYYLPYLAIIGMFSGTFTGLISIWLINHKAIHNFTNNIYK